MLSRMIWTFLFFGLAFLGSFMIFQWVEIIHIGGPVMIFIVMVSIFSLALIIERSYYFFNLHLGTDIERFFEQLSGHVEAHRWKDAQALCDEAQGPISRIVSAGIAVRDSSPQEIDSAMEDAAHGEMPAVEQHIRWLSTLAQVSTLLGLLGTVTGLVRAFQVIQVKASAGSPVNPGDLAGGVWEALITTVAGLIVAIPTILAYNYFAGRVSDVQFLMEKAASIVVGGRQKPPKPSHGSRVSREQSSAGTEKL